MKEYQRLIDTYSHEVYSAFSITIPEEAWGNKRIAETYLEKYWLPIAEYERVWKPVQKAIFVELDQTLPSMLFKQGYHIIALRGGVLFDEPDFRQLQECMLAVGDKQFVVVQNSFGGKVTQPLFRLKFPADISWKELMSGNFVSSVLCEMLYHEYFVFGESAIWGKYAANDYELPLDLVGFKPEYTSLFKRVFAVSKEEEAEIRTWLPPAYKGKVLW